MQTQASSALDNPVIITFDLLSSSSMFAMEYTSTDIGVDF